MPFGVTLKPTGRQSSSSSKEVTPPTDISDGGNAPFGGVTLKSTKRPSFLRMPSLGGRKMSVEAKKAGIVSEPAAVPPGSTTPVKATAMPPPVSAAPAQEATAPPDISDLTPPPPTPPSASAAVPPATPPSGGEARRLSLGAASKGLGDSMIKIGSSIRRLGQRRLGASIVADRDRGGRGRHQVVLAGLYGRQRGA